MIQVVGKAPDSIANAYASCNGNPIVIGDGGDDSPVGLFRAILREIDDADMQDTIILWSHPVYVIHDVSYLAAYLDKYDMVVTKQQGNHNLDMSIMLARATALRDIVNIYPTLTDDVHDDIDVRMSRTITQALGTRLRIIVNDGSIVKQLAGDMRGTGIVATHCGTPAIMERLQVAKLDVMDNIAWIMIDKYKEGTIHG